MKYLLILMMIMSFGSQANDNGGKEGLFFIYAHSKAQLSSFKVFLAPTEYILEKPSNVCYRVGVAQGHLTTLINLQTVQRVTGIELSSWLKKENLYIMQGAFDMAENDCRRNEMNVEMIRFSLERLKEVL